MMLENLKKIVADVDDRLHGVDATGFPDLFKTIPLEVFGALQIDRPHFCERLTSVLPSMPADQVQIEWTVFLERQNNDCGKAYEATGVQQPRLSRVGIGIEPSLIVTWNEHGVPPIGDMQQLHRLLEMSEEFQKRIPLSQYGAVRQASEVQKEREAR